MTPTTAIELLITDCRFVSNRGGALRLRGRRVQATIQSCTFSDNGEATLSAGGAIFTDSARVEIVASMFLSNVAEVGGAIACASGTVSLTRCEFRDNAATMQGAAISATGTLNLNVGGSRFEGNIAGVRGSAIDISKAMVRLKRSEISAPDCSSVSQVCVSDAGWLDASATSFSLPSACASVQVCLLACAALLACVGAAVHWSACAALAQGRYFESLAASSIAVRSSQFEPPLDAAELKEVIAGTLQRLEHRCGPTKPWTYLLGACGVLMLRRVRCATDQRCAEIQRL
jgi:hypothetical protein